MYYWGMPLKKPNKKQKVFIEEYLKTFNATQSAKNAGYSKRTAYSQGQRLLKHVEVAKAISKRMEKLKMSADEVLRDLATMAHGVNLVDYVEIKEVVKETKSGKEYYDVFMSFDLDKFNEDGYGHLVKRIKQTANGLDIELYDRKSALELIGKHHALFTEKIEQTNTGTIKVTISNDS